MATIELEWLCLAGFDLADEDRDLAEMRARDVEVGVHYPQPVHEIPVFASPDRQPSLPVAERAAREVVSLPIFPEITRPRLTGRCRRCWWRCGSS